MTQIPRPANDPLPPFVLPLALRQGMPDRMARLTVGLLALIHMAVLASLVMVLWSIGARAQESAPQEPAACGGDNLLERMRASGDPRLEEIETAADEVPNGSGKFWRIAMDGRADSYLYGTMHVSDPRVIALQPEVADALGEVGTVVIETDELVRPEGAQAAIFANPELTMFTDGTTLKTLLEPEDYALVEAELETIGVPIVAVQRMKPWMIASLVALPDCEMERKSDGAAFLDKQIAEDALAAGKVLKGLETIEEQLSAMASLPLEFHVQGLIETISLGPLLDDVMTTMTDLYLEGEIGTIMPMIRGAAPPSDPAVANGYADFEERIVLARNRTMAERALPILEEGGAFIAVGALHLPGEEGLVELLRAEGYTVTRGDRN
jgi:uncharacterized protein YbaP (TraB family)